MDQQPQQHEQKKEIPLSLFKAVAWPDGSIMDVNFALEQWQKDFGKRGEEVIGLLKEYGDLMGNSLVNGEFPDDSSMVQNPNRREHIQLVERRIEKITGFTAKELFLRRNQLNEEYRGKEKAPLKTVVIPRPDSVH